MTTRTLAIPATDGAMLGATELLPDQASPTDAPTVVLSHGWTLTRESWSRVAAEVMAHRAVRVITWDQRGHGRSTWGSAGSRSIRELGDDLATVIAATAPTGPLVLAGHSMGGMTVMAYAGAHPDAYAERVQGTVLVSTAAALEDRHGLPGESLLMGVASRIPLLSGRFLPTALHRWSNFGDHPDRDAVRAVSRQINRTSLQTTGRYFASLEQHDETASLATLGVHPTRILVGSKDRLTPVRWSRALHDGIPDSTLMVLPGRGHMLPYEATDIVADAIIEMIDSA